MKVAITYQGWHARLKVRVLPFLFVDGLQMTGKNIARFSAFFFCAYIFFTLRRTHVPVKLNGIARVAYVFLHGNENSILDRRHECYGVVDTL